MIEVVLLPEHSDVATDLLNGTFEHQPNLRSGTCSRLGRAMLAQMIARRTASSAKEWQIRAAPTGKPYGLQPESGRTFEAVSMSHSSGWVAAGIGADAPLGIDLERHKIRDYEGLSELAFGQQERGRAIRDGRRGFYRIWTLREAHAKADGRGLSLACDRRDRVHSGPHEGAWYAELDGAAWNLAHLEASHGLSLAIASKSAQQRPLEIRQLPSICNVVSTWTFV